MHRLNLKHIVLHFIAFLLIGQAAKTFSYLRNIELAEIIRTSKDSKSEIAERGIYLIELTDFQLAIGFGYIFGILVAFSFAIIICIKRKWFWLNSFISLCILNILGFFLTNGWDTLKYYFLLPGALFDGVGFYLANGIVLLLLGLTTLFWKRWIEKPKSNAASKQNPYYA